MAAALQGQRESRRGTTTDSGDHASEDYCRSSLKYASTYSRAGIPVIPGFSIENEAAAFAKRAGSHVPPRPIAVGRRSMACAPF